MLRPTGSWTPRSRRLARVGGYLRRALGLAICLGGLLALLAQLAGWLPPWR